MKDYFNLKYFNQSCCLFQQKWKNLTLSPQRLEIGSVYKSQAVSDW